MKNILVTGARAPASLDLVRKLHCSGLKVYATDCVEYPITRFSNKIEKYFKIFSPKKETKYFINELKKIIIKYKIDMLIPTCEEVFFISKYRGELIEYCDVFCEDFYFLKSLHNKYTVFKELEGCDIYLPKTTLIENKTELQKVTNISEKVFKPVYSRFASNILIRPKSNLLKNIQFSQSNPWVAQDYIPGLEICSYSIAVEGNLTAHTSYIPKYKIGLGSGVYYQPVFNQDIHKFVEFFVKKHNYTGQISFDYILNNKKLYFIECNPRITSGVHCFDDMSQWRSILSGEIDSIIIASKRSKVLSLVFLGWGGKYIMKNSPFRLIKDFLKAKDPVWQRNDIKPFFGQFLSLGELFLRSFKTKQPIIESSSRDIEWNGEQI